MSIKQCTKCLNDKSATEFCKDSGYKDGRRSDCNGCRNAARSNSAVVTLPKPLGYVPMPYFQVVEEQDLPPPEKLPAAYLKRCADYWIDLTGEGTATTRIV